MQLILLAFSDIICLAQKAFDQKKKCLKLGKFKKWPLILLTDL